MASPLQVQLILCDAAQSDSSGKIHMLGAGWSVARLGSAHAVAVLMKVPWDRANEPIQLTLDMRDQDGGLDVLDPSAAPSAERRVHAQGQIEVGRPPGIAPGSLLDAAFALNVAPLPIRPGRYEWLLTIDGQQHVAPFTIMG